MKNIGTITYLDSADMVRCGISINTVCSARRRNSYGYEVIDDPQDKRRILLRYDTLKLDLRARVDAVLGSSVGNVDRETVRTTLLSGADLDSLRHHRLPDGGSLPEQHIASLARACAVLHKLSTITRADLSRMGWSAERYNNAMVALIEAEGLPLPTAYTKLRAKVRDYVKYGYLCVISKRWCNSNSRKITEEIGSWLVAQYAQPTKPDMNKVTVAYNAHAKTAQWPLLTEAAIYHHLMQSDVKPLWYLGRHGVKHFNNMFGHKMKLRGTSFREGLWCGDGTKLNYWYKGEKGHPAALIQVYLVMDCHSEVILGWSLGMSENSTMQFSAIRMALQVSEHKPMQFLYDGQGGHKKKEQQSFFDDIASRLHFKAKANTPQAKPVENLIGRVQKQFMKERWFCTGQNVQSKMLDSKPNMDFVKDQVKAGHLPTKEQMPEIVMQDVEKWNNAKHPKSEVSRMELYRSSVNPEPVPFGMLDMVDTFWHRKHDPVTYGSQGIITEINRVPKHYEVYGADGLPDAEFIRKYTTAKFIMRYDPENLELVRLFQLDENMDLRYVATAYTKKEYARAACDLQPGERSAIDANLKFRTEQLERIKRELKEVRDANSMDPDTMVLMGAYGASKDDVNTAQSKLQTKDIDNTDDVPVSIPKIDPFDHM